jgi:RNA polymerase sigma-70 factor (ECF subfamily)
MEQEQQISIDALRSGDREAFAAMVDEYSPRLYRLALRMLGNPQEAEDVLQETFINAFKHMQQFEGRSQLSTWLYRIAANQALMRLRKNEPDMVSVDEPLQIGSGESVPRQLKDWCCLPEAEFMTSEAQAQLDQATRETAEILSISESAVKTRLLRARLELREKLNTYFSGRVEAIEHE